MGLHKKARSSEYLLKGEIGYLHWIFLLLLDFGGSDSAQETIWVNVRREAYPPECGHAVLLPSACPAGKGTLIARWLCSDTSKFNNIKEQVIFLELKAVLSLLAMEFNVDLTLKEIVTHRFGKERREIQVRDGRAVVTQTDWEFLLYLLRISNCN